MNIKLLSISISLIVAVLAYAAPVGSTSEQWKVVITPCAWCGRTNDIEVHHIVPQHISPELAYDTNNMVCLCRTDGKGCHFYIGHHGVSWDYVFTNVMKIIIKEGSK
jgi:hypothetical protein